LEFNPFMKIREGHAKYSVVLRSRSCFISLSKALFAFSLGAILAIGSSGYAQDVTTNITSSGLHTIVPAQPPTNGIYDITGGTRVGTNVYHGLGIIDVARGDVANFLNKGSVDLNGQPLGDGIATSNILARVTGGHPSQIFGTLRTTDFGNANLFLLNPSGIVFGPTASLDIGATSIPGDPRGSGSFYAGTADYLRLSDGTNDGYFYANPIHTDVLTTSPVVAFGFLTLGSGMIRGDISVQGSNLAVSDGQTIGFVGGNVTIGAAPLTGTPATLSAPDGQIQLGSTASPGEFILAGMQSAPNVNLDSFTSYGSLQLAAGSLADVSGTGKISIRGGAFTLEVREAVLSTETIPSTPGGTTIDSISMSRESAIVTSTSGAETGADLQMAGRSVDLAGASITSITTGDGAGGAITVTAEDSVSLTDGAQIVSRSEGNGYGGNISLDAASETGAITISGYDLDGTLSGVMTPFLFNPLTGDPIVVSGLYSMTSGAKSGGNIGITAPTVSLQEGAVVATVTSGDARGGNIATNGDTVQITGGAEILSVAGQDFSAPNFDLRGTGSGGDIFVSATDSVTVSGGNLDLFTPSTIATQTLNSIVDPILGQGQGGSITVSAPNIILDDAGRIASTTQGSGMGGTINLSAINELSISGFSQDFGVGSAIITMASDGSNGTGGAVNISGSSVTVENGGRIASDQFSIGNGGDITVTVTDINLRNGGSITSSGIGSGSSGHIQVTTTGDVSVSGNFLDPNNPGAPPWSVVKNITEGSGLNGGIDIHAGKLIMKDGPQFAPNQDVGQIESSTEAPTGGTIHIVADNSISMSNGANIINRKGSFESGSISLTAPSISLDQSAIRGRTNIDRDAGAITLNATSGNLTLANASHILTSTLQSSGNAGPILAQALNSIQLSGGSTMESSSSSVATGDGGAMTLTAGNQVNLSGTGTALQSTTGGSGNGGNINVSAGQSVSLTNGSSISSSSTGPGNAGNILVNAGQQLDMRDSSIKTEATQAGGGNIGITAHQQIRLVNAQISASAFGDGGNITIDPLIMAMQNSQIIAQAVQGVGGNITIFTPLFLADQTSLVSASSQFGLNGTVTIQSPTSNLSGSVGSLPSSISQQQALQAQRCALSGGASSSFVIAGRDTIPTEPGSWLAQPLGLYNLGHSLLAETISDEQRPTILAMAQTSDTISLRHLTPAGFLTQRFAGNGSDGCRS
jgi:filamentous hemagglutinin family protein